MSESLGTTGKLPAVALTPYVPQKSYTSLWKKTRKFKMLMTVFIEQQSSQSLGLLSSQTVIVK